MPRPLANPRAKRSRAGSKRRAAGWMLLTLGLLAAGVWVASGVWARLGYWNGNGSIYIGQGALVVSKGWPNSNAPSQWLIERNDPPFWWWWFGWREYDIVNGRVFCRGLIQRGSGNGISDEWVILLWPLPILLWTTGGLALWSGRRARRRAQEGHCPTCGYNLAGLNRDAGVGVCPECGKAKGTK